MQTKDLFSVEPGQTVYALGSGNAARYEKNPIITMQITKIGRKYFYAESYGWSYKFEKDTFRCVANDGENSDYILFSSMENLLYHIAVSEMRDVVHSVFADYFTRDKIPDAVIETIYNILVQEKIIKEE